MDQTERLMDTSDMDETKRTTKTDGSDTERRATSGDGPNKQADDGGARHNNAPDTLPARAHYSGGNGEGQNS